jgi:hypothetical protein
MIELRLIRTNPKDIKQTFTHGNLFVKDILGKWIDFSYTLEDTVRDINKNGKFDGDEKKIYGKTAIPFGKYEGQVTMSSAFKREMPLIKDVPEFIGIRMHGGNTDKDSLGCILVAHNTDNKGKIWGSAERDLTKLIKADNKEGKFTIEII